MAERRELELRAAKANVVSTAYPNDSKFEQAILFAEKASIATATATTLAPTASVIAATSGDKNV